MIFAQPTRRAVRRGLTLIETMVSLLITATLLTAAAAAYQASSSAVASNSDFFRASQAARVTMNQVLAEIRKAESIQVYSDHIDVIRPSTLLTPGEVFRRYYFDSTNSRITLQIFTTGNTAGPLYELASNVSSATFGPAQMGQDWNNTLVAQHVPVSITVTLNKNYVTLSGAAGPWRAQKSF